MIHFTVLGKPTPQKRHRHFSRFGKSGKVFTGTYDPSAEGKDSFISIAHQYAPKEPLSGPLQVDIAFYMPRPKNHYRTGRNSSQLKPNIPKWHTGKPDIDNLRKFVQDALSKVFWKDDSQICFGCTKKLYSESPKTEVYIKEIKD